MKKTVLPLIAIATLVTACVPSVYPFYTDKDVITDSRLPGAWVSGSNGKSTTWTFEATTNDAFTVALTDEDGKTGAFEGRLFKLGAETFLDLTPTECHYAHDQAGFLNSAMIPGHLLLHVKLDEKILNLAVCDPDWVKKFLKANPSAIAHRMVDDNVIFIAETQALQKFVLEHLGEGELFTEATDYHRQMRSAEPK